MKACGATKPAPHSGVAWVCTRTKGHAGLHIARGIGNVVLKRWKQ